ncbi:O-antigen ligase family protein [Hymenobacter sediminicola]|uniref:O-antigen ligase family protein n=1 Tax=Hymenobacter sediminicola TaxID=2761579 RepID=A0A7G7W3R6_9BACT|nr:O-antigen ligase family protein [Hymenobacter sediminicola]QNH61009.1 O-antigen ligase family protein [Hymenobacter sediminicola]
MSFLARLRPQNPDQRLFVAFVGLLLVSGTAALLLRTQLWLALPVAVLGAVVLLVDWRWVYYLLLGMLAFSIEMPLPGGLSMDVPSEPLMLVLLGCFGVSVLLGNSGVSARVWRHPLVIFIGLALLWSVVSTAFSVSTLKSVKYLLAKTWYIVPFVFVTLAVVRKPSDVWRMMAFFAVGVSVTVLYTMARHGGKGFGFNSINWAIQPFYHNHVLYAATAALLVPFALYAARDASSKAARWLWYLVLFIAVSGVMLSYTRASVLSLVVAALYYGIVRLRLTRLTLMAASLAALVTTAYFVRENTYMLYAPEFEKTVFNKGNFEKHLEATYKLQDVSGMERVYRWVAAAHMIADKPLVGSGPATFYPEYKRYTVRSFRTYVSDNVEKSTTHNYFLLQLAEQGVPGFLLFVALIFTALLLVERLYHNARTASHRRIAIAAGLSLVITIFHLLLNELVEVDKIGSIYYVSLALLIRVQLWQQDAANTEQEAAAPPLLP